MGSNLEAKIHPCWLQNPLIHFKKQIDFETIFPIFLMFFIDSHFKARIEGFVKNSIFPKEHHDFYNSEIKLKFKIRLREFSKLIDFRSKKPSKLEVKIHKNRSKIEYRKLSQMFFDFGGRGEFDGRLFEGRGSPHI